MRPPRASALVHWFPRSTPVRRGLGTHEHTASGLQRHAIGFDTLPHDPSVVGRAGIPVTAVLIALAAAAPALHAQTPRQPIRVFLDLQACGEISWRVVRGLSVSAEANASRIHDQLSLPRCGATPEEIFLRLRQLQSGDKYDFRFSLTYSFGSIFSSVANPRFGS
jgi:hypothetical protein